MNHTKPLKKLLNSTRQYHARALLGAEEFISQLNDTILELQLSSKIDTDTLSKEIRNFVMTMDWFGHISAKITENFYDRGLHIDIIDKEGSKLQYVSGSDKFANYIITEYIQERHKKRFGTAFPKLYNNQGIKISDIPGDWHAVTQENGLTTIIEAIVVSLIEYEHSYIAQLASSGTLPTPQNIQKIFSSVRFDNSTEANVIQILEQCTELYLSQYELSSILLPFHLGDEGVSSNIDRIYEKYSSKSILTARKTMGMITALNRNNSIPDKITPIRRRVKQIVQKPKETVAKIGNHKETESDNQAKITKLQKKVPEDQSTMQAQEQNPEPVLHKELSPIESEPQEFKVTNEPNYSSSPEIEVPDNGLSIEKIFEKYCEKRISHNEYRIAGEFYLKKEHDRWIIVMQDGYKTIGKGEDAFEEPIYKRVSKTPYFIVAKTEHLQSGDQGVQLVAINNNKMADYTSLTLGEADSKKVKSVLRNKGILIESPKLNADYIDNMYQTVNKQLFISDEVGWVEHAGQFGFVLPQKFGIGISGLEYSGKNQKLLHAIETKGDLGEWLSIFKSLDLEKAHPRIAFLLFSSLLPLFANFHDTFEGFVINITPDYTEGKGSSNGKTTVQQLMLSLQGSVEDWHTNWNKTALAMEEYLYTNVGAYFDDTSKTKMKPQELEDLIYSISDAESRGSSRQSTRTRKTVMYSTGERDFLQHTGKDGVYVRYVDVGIKRNDYGSNDPEQTRKIVDHIKKTVVSNYGFVYPEAIRIFLENRDMILQKTDEYIEEMAQYGQYDNASRIAKRYAMIAVCGEVFIEIMRGLTGNKDLYGSLDPFAISLDMFKVHDNKLVEMEQTQETISVNLLSDLLNKFTGDEQNNLYDNDGNVVGFVDGDNYCIRSKEVTKHLPDGMTKTKFTNNIDKALIVDTGKNITRKHIDDGKAIRYDIFKRPTA